MGQWAERDTPPHPEWSSSSDVADTGEVFGIIDALSREQIANNLDHDNPTAVAQAAANEMSELEIKMADNEDDLMEDMPASTCWLATLHGRDRAYGRLESRDEWIYFNIYVGRFQCAPG